MKHGLKVEFFHMRDHFGLPAELDAPVLFNMAPAYKGDSDSATSPSLWCVSEWERRANSAESASLPLCYLPGLLLACLAMPCTPMVPTS